MNYQYTALVEVSVYSQLPKQLVNQTSRKSKNLRDLVKMQELRNPRRETTIPRQKSRYLSTPATELNLAEFACRNLVVELEEQLPENMIVFLWSKDSEKAVKVE